jgi:hypothetical protein
VSERSAAIAGADERNVDQAAIRFRFASHKHSEELLPLRATTLVVINEQIDNVHVNDLNRLVQELLRGGPRRSIFSVWEMEFLLDMETCRIRKTSRENLLRRYQRAVQKSCAASGAIPTLSAFVAVERSRRCRRELH